MWNFGDGSTSTSEKPTYSYNKPGVYAVTLIVQTAGGCSDTMKIEKAVMAGIAPKAQFSADPLDVCARISVDSKILQVVTLQTGCGNLVMADSQACRIHRTIILIPAGFLFSLIVSNNDCKDSITRQDYVYIRPPVAKYVSSFNCSKPFERVFTDHI